MSLAQNDLSSFGLTDLCEACVRVMRTCFDKKEAAVLPHHDSYESLAQSSRQNCCVCSDAVTTIEKECGQANAESLLSDLTTTATFYMAEAKEWFYKFEIFPFAISTRYTVIKFRLLPSSASFESINSGAELSLLGDDTSSSATMSLASKWYTGCRENHTQCKLPLHRQDDWQPTRLISIGSSGNNDWRLCQSPIPNWPVEYMTLSYRWGSQSSLTLHKKNIEQFCQGMPISSLPRTFQDAVAVARQFSVKYLWIDALCIMQDSPEDWNHEASEMRYVYSHSSCNIAASAAADQYSGLFSGRNTRQSLPGIIRSSLISSEIMGEHLKVFDKEYWDRQLRSGPLHDRGWVFQECLLAPRVLYFAANQILWGCFKDNKCEGFPDGIPHHEHSKDLSFLWDSSDYRAGHRRIPEASGKMSFRLHALWNTLVERYTSCDLTYHKDKLPAFYGIARLFMDVTGDEYLAGVWRSKLCEQLVWRVGKSAEPLLQPGVPSWSWASIRGRIETTGLSSRRNILTSIVNIEYDNHSDQLQGTKAVTSLRLMGTLSTAGSLSRASHPWNILGKESLDAECYFDSRAINFDGCKDKLYFMPVLSNHPWYPAEKHRTEMVGLLLTPVSEQKPNEFRRIGMFTTESSRDIERLGFEISSEGLALFKDELAKMEMIVS